MREFDDPRESGQNRKEPRKNTENVKTARWVVEKIRKERQEKNLQGVVFHRPR